jgi:DNA/RNA-binding domain of Phe-tRNA-synthetase-like protein
MAPPTHTLESAAKGYTFSVADEIFEAFPTLRRAVVVGVGINNRGRHGDLDRELHDAAIASEQLMDLETDPRLTCWNAIYRWFGADTRQFPPVHATLLRKPPADRLTTTKVTAIITSAILRFRLPVDADDILNVGPHLTLRPAFGLETFVGDDAFDYALRPDPGATVTEKPELREVVYVDVASSEVVRRRWHWKSSARTRVTEATTTVAITVDAFGEDADSSVRNAAGLISTGLHAFCGGIISLGVLSPEYPVYHFTNAPS